MRARLIEALPWLRSIRPLLTIVDPVAVLLAGLIVGRVGGPGDVADPAAVAAAAIAAVLVCRGADLHRSRLILSVVEDLPRLALAAVVAALTLAALTPAGGVRLALLFAGVTLGLMVVLRTAVYALAHFHRRSGRSAHPTIIVGAGAVGQRLTSTFLHRRELGLLPVGIIDTSPDRSSRDLPVPLLGDTDHLERAMADLGVADVVFAFPEPPDDRMVDVVRRCVQADHQVFIVPRFFEMMGIDHHRTELIGDVALMRLSRRGLRPHTMLLKRAVDVVLSSIALVLLSPVLVACAVAVRLETGPGVIFKQTRVGLGGRPFVLFKFRSLKPVDAAESATHWSIDQDDRLGPVGRFLRRTSLDELPQLVNVLRGDMSLVGPRPERPFFVREFSKATVRYDERHRVQTGLTGWAQVHDLRGDTSIDARVRFDNYYIENWSLWTDLKIMCRTVLAIVRHQPDTRAPILHRPAESADPRVPAPRQAEAEPTPHVLHVSMPTTEGVANVLMGYVRDQVARGWTVTVACPSSGWLAEAARASGAQVVRWEATRNPGPGILREIRRLRRIVNDSRPDVVHLHSAKAGLVGRLLLRGVVPTIYQPHAWSFQAVSGPMRRATTSWERFGQRWTTELICVSRSERAVAESVGISTAATISPNGVDLERFRPAARQERTHARRRLGIADVPTVVCVGRLAAQKGQADLLDAWEGVRDRVPDAHLVLVGDGPDRSLLEARTADLGDVDLVGVRSDVDTWFAAADVIAAPSHWEGMAVAPLEAMASGRSVVATNVEGMAESMARGGGLIVNIGDVDALADGIAARLLDPDLADQEGAIAQQHIALHHDVNSSARDVARLTLRQFHRGRGTADVLMSLEPMSITTPRRRRRGGGTVAVPAGPEKT